MTIEGLELIMNENLMFKGVLRFLGGNKIRAFVTFRECWKTFKKYENYIIQQNESNSDSKSNSN
jgi:hypothetical protein